MKKKMIIIGIALAMVFTSIIVTLANVDIGKDVDEKMKKNVIESVNEEMDKGFKKVKDEITKIKKKDFQDISVENSIKIYSLNEPDIVKSYNEANDFSKLISSEYLWNIKVDEKNGNGSSVLKLKENKSTGEIKLIGYSSNDVVGMETILSKKELKKILSQTHIESINDIKYVRIPMYHINILYVQSDKGEYALAFDSRPDLTGLKKGKVYKMRQFIDILDKNFNY